MAEFEVVEETLVDDQPCHGADHMMIHGSRALRLVGGPEFAVEELRPFVFCAQTHMSDGAQQNYLRWDTIIRSGSEPYSSRPDETQARRDQVKAFYDWSLRQR